MTRLNRSLEDLASRGRPRGASDVFAGATFGLDGTAGPVEPRVRPLMAFAAAFGGVLMVGLVMAVVMSGGERAGQVGSPSATTPTGAPCLAPPVEATGTEGASFFVDVKPAEVTAGSLANLTLAVFEGDPAGFVSGLDTAWQCWDGSEWVDIFQLLKGTAGYAPGVAEPGSGIDAIGLILPLEASILIPDVGPGIYRVFESAAGDDGMRDSWTFVQVVDPETSVTTTTAPEMTTLPPGNATPVTVPQGADLIWYDFIPGTVQLAWRSTAGGTEMCWRTIAGEDCVDDDFRAPEVVIIAGPDHQPIVLTRPPFAGKAPERIALDLSDGTTIDAAPLYPGQGVALLWALADRLPQGVSVVGARTANWPAPSCQTPPSSALDVSDSAFEMWVSSGPAHGGQIIELFMAPSRQGNITGISTLWQCWDGSTWISTHVGSKVSRETSGDPQIYQIESNPAFPAVGVGLPDTFRIRVPDLPPGTYRIEDYVGTETGWVIVQIEN